MSKKLQAQGGSDLKICIIGDEDTVTGFLLTGIGLRDPLGNTNYLIVDKKTTRNQIESAFRKFIERSDIAILLINQYIADEIRSILDLHQSIIPTILELPSKDKPYDPNKDSVMQRVKLYFGGIIPGE